MASSQPIPVKAVLLGDTGVGKSSLFLRFTEGAFRNDPEPTMGASFGHQTIETNSGRVKFNVWDTAGQERFRAVTKMYYKDARVAILVYDITNRDTFESLKSWHDEISESCSGDLSSFQSEYVVVGNKEDLVDREAVSMEEAKKWAQTILALYKKTSAMSSLGVESLFRDLAEVFVNSETRSLGVHLESRKSHCRSDKASCQC